MTKPSKPSRQRTIERRAAGEKPSAPSASKRAVGVSAEDTLMQFAIFGSAQADSERPGAALGEGFHESVEFNVEAEALGYCASFLVEHHFTGWNQVSATLQLLTWLAARTTTLRLGTAVLVLPWHNPVLLAEQAATLDLMSGGRLDFGIGKGYRHTEFEGFCIPPEEAQVRFDEALEIILKAWTTARAILARGPLLAIQERRRRSAPDASAASSAVDGHGESRLHQARSAARAQSHPRSIRLDVNVVRAHRTVRGGSRGVRPPLRSHAGCRGAGYVRRGQRA